MNDSSTWYSTSSDTAPAAAAVAEPPRGQFAIAAGSALLVLGLGLAIAGTVDANSGTDAATNTSAATGQGCNKSTDSSPVTSPDPANA